MGRVAKYKKVKSFDKQHRGGEYIWGSKVTDNKKKRSKTAERLHQEKLQRKRRKGLANNDDGLSDLPFDGKDEFNTNDFKVKKQRVVQDLGMKDDSTYSIPTVSSSSSSSSRPSAKVKGNKVKIGDKTVTCAIPKDDEEERRTAKALNINMKSGKTMIKGQSSESTHIKIEGRREGESMRAFNKRLREQTKLALAHDFKRRSGYVQNQNDENSKNEEGRIDKKERRKEFLKNKKLKKKKGGRDYDIFANQNQSHDKNEEQDSDDFITGEQAAAASLPSFLEQAEAPPVFSRLPRGAQKLSKKTKKEMKKAGMDDKAIKAEQDAMEAMRRKVQAQYSIIKAQRRKEGSFHL